MSLAINVILTLGALWSVGEAITSKTWRRLGLYLTVALVALNGAIIAGLAANN